MYKMTVQLPNLPKGAEVAIDGLGVFENGYEYDISEEQANTFRARNAAQLFSHDKDGNLEVKTEQGPTLLQAYKKDDGIEVVKMSDTELKAFKQEKDKNEDEQPELPLDNEGDGE